MQQAQNPQAARLAELQRIYIRFANVADDKQLGGILSKILPKIMMIYLEPEQQSLQNGGNLVVDQLDQIMQHLVTRVTCSKGACKPPITDLLGIINTPTFGESRNLMIKAKVLGHIFGFLQVYSMSEGVQEEDQKVYMICLEAITSESLQMQCKCRLFVLCLHRMMLGYLNKKTPEGQRGLVDLLNVIFAENTTLKKSFVHFGFLLVVGMFPHWQNNLRILFEEAMMNYFERSGKLTETHFKQGFEATVFTVIANKDVFPDSKEFLPILLISSADTNSAISQQAKAMMQATVLDTEDLDLASFIYQMIFGNYNMFFSEDNPNFIPGTPFHVQEHLISYLMKFPQAVVQKPFNLKLVDHCLFDFRNVSKLQSSGLRFIRNMLHSTENMEEATMWHLKNTLERIRTQTQEQAFFREENVAMSYLLLAELASKNYHLVFGSEVTLALDVFEQLQHRVEECTFENKPVRMDDIALTLMEAINKFRDCFELHLRDESNRQRLVSFVEKFLANEGASSNSEIVYIMFLYLSRLGGEKLIPSILLNSIILKTHEDIKIKKEAQTQLDRFAKAEDSALQGLLYPFLTSLRPFLKDHLITTMEVDRPDQLASALAPVMDVTSAKPIDLEFIEKVEQMSKFAYNFYKREQNEISKDDCKQELEKLLLTNMHESFSKLKSDYTNVFKLIQTYLTDESEAPILSTVSAARSVSRLSHGQNCVNLDQKMLGLKLMFQMLSKQESQQSECLHALYVTYERKDKDQTDMPKGQEQKLSLLYRDTLSVAYSSEESVRTQSVQRFIAFANLAVTEKLGPNSMELTKMIANSMALLAKNRPLKDMLQLSQPSAAAAEESKEAQLSLDAIIEKMREMVCNRSIDLAFKSQVLTNMAPLCNLDAQMAATMAQSLMDSLKDYDQSDFQPVLGSVLCSLWTTEDKLAEKCDFLIEQVTKGEGLELNIKRNFTVYLHSILTDKGETSQAIKERLLPLQKIFLRFLFDRRSSMQDLASKSLSVIYNLGDEETRRLLVNSLSSAFTGKSDPARDVTTAQELEEYKKEELPKEFQDITSTEQRQKMKTYQDLVNVANQLGSEQLIYSFLEIHRSVTHLQDVQNAAKGLSNIILLDTQLKADLTKLAPTILLLTYDQNKEVSHTMRQLWTVLIDIDQEAKVIEDRWSEIYEEAFKSIKSTENPRNKLRAIRAMTDLMGTRTWAEMQCHFRVIFLTSLASLESEKGKEKAACYQLAKELKRIALRLGNVYTNGNEVELRQVLSTVIPMVLDDCLKSGIEPVRWFGLDLLSEIVMTAKSQNMAEKLKIQSKHERQLVFNHNSNVKIKQILNVYMERIVVEIVGNTSMLSKAVGQINALEQLAVEMGYIKKSGNERAAERYGISERDIADMRTKVTKQSTQGEILAICREMMVVDTFDKILPALLQYSISGHDITTKQIAMNFINDAILEGRIDLISPKNSRVIARKMVELYSQSTVQAGLDMKESLQQLYASCLGQQMKILKEFPNTIKQLLDNLADLDPALEIIKVINLNEILKGIPESMIEDDEGNSVVKRFVPNIFVNRFKSSEDSRLKSLSKRIWDMLLGNIPNLAKTNCSAILGKVAEMFESTAYDDRVASAQALQELCSLVSEGQLEDPSFEQAITAIMTLITGKYFPGKESLVECLSYLVDEDYLTRQDRKIELMTAAISQAQKASGNYNDYKNVLIQALRTVASKVNVSNVPSELVQEIFDFLIVQMTESLEMVMNQEGSGMLAEQDGVFFDIMEKREDEKATLKTIQVSYSVMPQLLKLNLQEQSALSMLQMLTQVSEDKFVRTNWLVRQAILVCFKGLLEQKRSGQMGLLCLEFGAQLVSQAAEYGEKYDQNLVYLSSLTLLVAEQQASAQLSDFSQEKRSALRESATKLITILQEKGSEVLIQNVDLIRRYIGHKEEQQQKEESKGQNQEDATMKQE